MPEDKVNLALIEQDLKYIKDSVKEIKNSLDKNYVTIDQFAPVKSIVYGMVGLILTSIVVAMLTLIIRK